MSILERRRSLLFALGASPWFASRSALAQAPIVPEEGADYTVLANPQATDTPGKIEVLDFFWYGCPHCYAFLPDLEAWRKRLPADIVYKHVPSELGDPGREPHTRIFYALQVLGRVDDMHTKVFDAVHLRHMRLLDRDEIADFMAQNGIARDKWLAAYDSFSVAGAVQRARMLFRAYTIDGTPTLAIDGRFLTSPTLARSHTNAGALAVADFLIDRSRRDHAKKKA